MLHPSAMSFKIIMAQVSTFMQMVHSYMLILDDVKKWLSANKLKLNADKTEFIIFGVKIQCEKLNKSFPVNILGSFLCQGWSGTLVYGLIVIFPFQGMSRISASSVLLKSGTLIVSEVI